MATPTNTNGPAGEAADRRELLVRVLGKAVHPKAIDRLLEVWPEAAVEVEHGEGDVWVPAAPVLGGYAWRRWTRVTIRKRAELLSTDPMQVARMAFCHPDDQFTRRDGIRAAFDKCLREAVRREDGSRVAGLGRTL